MDLDSLTFPEGGFRPFFFDYDARLASLALLRKSTELPAQFGPQPETIELDPNATNGAVAQSLNLVGVQPSLVGFLEALATLRDLESRDAEDIKHLHHAAEGIEDLAWRSAALKAMKYPFLQALEKLMGIALGRPVGSKFGTIYQVLDAALQESATTQRRFAYLYLEAWAAYRPKMKSDQEQRLSSQRNAIRSSMHHHGESCWPDEWFANLTAALFPSLAGAVREIEGRRLLNPSPLPVRAKRTRNQQYIWNAPFNREQAKAALSVWRARHPDVDWKNVINNAYNCYKSNMTPIGAAGHASIAGRVDSQQVLTFMVECGMLSRR